MPNDAERHLTLRQADQGRTDFAIIETELEAIHARLAGMPTRMDLARAAAHARLIVWCKACQHQVEPDPAEMAARYGAATPVLYWREKLVCSKCGGRQVDMVVTGTRR